MSLAVLADHMASKGRGPDSMLVHMSPRELQGLQALAMKHGGSLTINPDTGLPEAGFLDKLLPAIIGFALAPMTAGTSLAFLGATPLASAMTVGALQTLRTGDLGKGLMAGFSAYGGAGLQAGLATAGTGALSAEVGGKALEAAGLTGEAALSAEADQIAQRAIGEKLATATPYETLSAGFNSATSSPQAAGAFLKDNFKPLMYAAGPILADQAVKSNMPTTTTRPGAVHTFSYNPYDQLYTPTGNYEVPVKAAGGGLMGMNDGGYSPGQLDFAQHSEPVLRMAAGGSSYSTVREDGSVFDDLDQQNRDASREVIQEVPPRPIAPDLVNPLIFPATPAPVQGTPITGGLDTLADRMAPPVNTNYVNEPYTEEKMQVEPPIGGGMPSEEELARKTALSSVTPDLIRTKTAGTTGGLDTLAANQNAAAITGATTGTTGGLDALAANQTATADANAAAKLGIFQKVYDPKNGREFVSPAQAFQWGVTDYVTEMPMKLEFLNDTSRKAVTDTMAGGLTFEQAIDKLGSKYGMSGKDFYNYQVQGGLKHTGGNPVATESGGLKPDELVAKLQAFKDKPPTTAQEFQEQQGLYADYRNRYANSSWNYANMGGKPQDYSLKPKDYLGLEFTGYAEPINFALSNMIQRGGQYKEMAKILTANPEINDVIDQLYKLNPEQSIFNSINPKYSELNANSASGFNTSLIRLAGDIERLGKDAAIQKFISQQQNLLSVLPDAQGNLGNFNQTTMSNPEYRALNAIKDSYTPRINDSAWNERVEKQKPIRDRVFGDIYRDPTTGKGLTVEYGKNGNPQSLVFFNQQGNRVSSGIIQNPEQLLEAAYESGIPMSAVAQFAETIGKDVIKPSGGSSYWPKGLESYTLNDLASGKIASIVASDDWFNFMAADKRAKTPQPTFADMEVAKLKSQQKMAKDYLADTTGTATTGALTQAATGSTTGDATSATTTGALTTTANNTGVAAPANAGLAALNTGATTGGTSLANAQAQVNNMYRNVLGRDADPTGLAFWSNAIASGRSAESIYQDFLTSARANTELVRADQIKNKTFAEATTPYTGYMSSEGSNIVDEWVRNTLGREPTAADRQQQWYKDAADKMTTQGQAQDLYGQFKTYATKESNTEIANRVRAIDAELKAKGLTDADLLKQTGKTKQQLATEGLNLDLNWMGASQLAPAAKRTGFDLEALKKTLTPNAINNTFDSSTKVDRQITNPYGNKTNPGDLTFNRDGSTTVTPNIPYRPYGGFSGMDEVRGAYTQGGGSLGYVPYAPKTMDEFNAKYNTLSGGSKQAYDYLTGKSAYSATPYTPTGEVMKPYSESVLGVPRSISSKQVLFDPVTKTYKKNPDYIPVSYTSKGEKVYGLSSRDIASQLPGMDAKSDYEKWMKDNNVTYAQIAEALGISLAEAKKRYRAKTATEAVAAAISGDYAANGGLMAMAGGGMAQQFDLGGYSDGGRLLRGPGDGVSDSIPATIGNKRPARLADGEFVVPARIVSELGNGSTEAGARKLYAMMDRVQAARRGSIGKGKVAKNSRADKYLPV